MRILAIGDVVGTVGCEFLRSRLPRLKREEKIDLVVANGENSAAGNGITPESAKYLFSGSVDIITGGNHSFRRREIFGMYEESPFLLRPANYPLKTTPGRGYTLYDMGRIQVGIINLLGCTYMESLENPFDAADRIIKEMETRIIIVDFHAEATSEKLALAYYLDGRVSAIFGTHTHVQTADEKILSKGTGYITDVGMTGPEVSVLGVEPELAIRKFREKLPVRFENAGGSCRMDGIIFDIDEKSGSTISLKRIQIR